MKMLITAKQLWSHSPKVDSLRSFLSNGQMCSHSHLSWMQQMAEDEGRQSVRPVALTSAFMHNVAIGRKKKDDQWPAGCIYIHIQAKCGNRLKWRKTIGLASRTHIHIYTQCGNRLKWRRTMGPANRTHIRIYAQCGKRQKRKNTSNNSGLRLDETESFVNLYIVTKNTHLCLPMYSGWGTWWINIKNRIRL